MEAAPEQAGRYKSPTSPLAMWIGQWTPFVFHHSSNWKELKTLLLTLQAIHRARPPQLDRATLFYFTDNSTTYPQSSLQGVARAKSLQQPHRFLVINILNSRMTCDQLYEYIQKQLGVANLGLPPDEVAEVVRYGLLGPANQDGSQANLPATANSCRKSIESAVTSVEKKNDFPILVIDEFNPRDFTDEDWPDGTDFSLQQVAEKMGEAFQFFSQLAGMAYAKDGFVVFLGSRSKAVARALFAINCGTKAALAPCTKRDGLGGRFEDWQGFDWTDDGKQRLLTNMYENDYKNALRAQGLSDENEIEKKWLCVVSECISQPNIRGMCDAMKVELDAENGQSGVLLQSRTEESVGAESCCDLAGQGRDTCIIMQCGRGIVPK